MPLDMHSQLWSFTTTPLLKPPLNIAHFVKFKMTSKHTIVRVGAIKYSTSTMLIFAPLNGRVYYFYLSNINTLLKVHFKIIIRNEKILNKSETFTFARSQIYLL